MSMDWRIDATNILNRVTYSGLNTISAARSLASQSRERDAQAAVEPAGEVLMRAKVFVFAVF